MTKRLLTLFLIVAASAATLLVGEAARATPAAEARSLSGLKVLIVNDDSIQATSPSGRDGLGLFALRKSMCAAGADVLVVGPWSVQSGQGGRITLSGATTVQQVAAPSGYGDDCADAPSGGKVFGVCSVAGTCAADSPSGSPSDAARVALTRFLPDNYWAAGPDLVLSGINFGQNDALSVIHSGTVNAATVASHLGYPAIAFSEELTIACLRGTLADCPVFTGTADFGVALVEELRESDLITPDLFLNVNYPHLADGETVREPVYNVLGECSGLNFGFNGSVGASGGTYTAGIVPSCTESRRNADTTALEDNHISVVPLDGDGTAARPDGRLRALVDALG